MPEVKDLGLANNEIVSVQRTSGNGAPGTTDTWTITLRGGQTFSFTITNGSDVDGSPNGIFATVSALTAAHPTGDNHIYLVSADGNWYYWNSTNAAWTAGGQYLSTSPAVPASRTIAGIGLESDITENALFDKMSIKGRYATLTALQTANPNHGYCYLVEENNHWYYHNGAAWTDGGVYNSTAFESVIDDVFTDTEMQASATSSGWRLVPETGLCASNASYKITKYTVTAGKSYKVVSDDYFQFQTVDSVPSNGTSNRIGDTYATGTYYVTAPVGATYLIFSTPATDSTAKAYEIAMTVDPTLSISGEPADAKVVGNIFSDVIERVNWFAPGAPYKFVAYDGVTSRDTYVTNNGDGSFTCKMSHDGIGQVITLNTSGITMPAGTYTMSARVTLNESLPDTTTGRNAYIKIGVDSTGKTVPITTEWGGNTQIADTEKVGYVHGTFTLGAASTLAFMVEVENGVLGSTTYPYVVDMIQIEEGEEVSAYDSRNFTAVDALMRRWASKQDITEIKTALYNDNRIIYTTLTARHSYSVVAGGKCLFHVGARLNVKLSNGVNWNDSLAWEDISSDISDAIVITDGKEADITINPYHSLVYNTTDKLLHLRNLQNNTANHMDDVLLLANAYGIFVKGVLWDEYIDRKVMDDGGSGDVTSDEILVQSFNSAYHVGATNFADKCTEFASLLCGTTDNNHTAPTDFESFLFFTDPHLAEGTTWQPRCYEYIAQIQKYYNSTPTTFCICGGDWLGNSDLPETACFKLGYIDGFMHSMFDRCYMLVGNHDTNYQGKKDAESAPHTTKLTNQSIADLWYRNEGRAYYSFDGVNTRFYCFDTGTEGQTLGMYDNYGWKQAQWFANALLTDNHSHIAIVAHILYDTVESMVIHPLADKILEIAEAYNNRTTINVNGTSYDYSGKTGKVDYALFGHAHGDHTFTIHNIPCVVTTWVRAGSNSPTFDLALADYDNRQLKFIRVGSGENRTINMS